MLKGVILNEKDIVEKFLIDKKFPEGIKKTDVIRLLIKHYHTENTKIDKDKMFKLLLEDLKSGMETEFVYTKWDKTLKAMIGSFYKNLSIYKNDNKLINIEKIIISPSEISYIQELQNDKLERIAFVLLVYAKIFNALNKKNDSWVRISPTIICKEADAKLRGIDQFKKLHELYEKKYISMSNMNFKTGIKVNYCDDVKEGIEIADFNKVVNQYILLVKDKVKYCSGCGDIIEITGNRKKYCKECGDISERENTKNRVKKHRKSKM